MYYKDFLVIWSYEDDERDLTDIIYDEIIEQNAKDKGVPLNNIVKYYGNNAPYQRQYVKYGDSNEYSSVAGSVKMLARIVTGMICKVLTCGLAGDMLAAAIVEFLDQAVANYINYNSLNSVDKCVFQGAKKYFGADSFSAEDLYSSMSEDISLIPIIIRDTFSSSLVEYSLKRLSGLHYLDETKGIFVMGEAVLDLRDSIWDAAKNIIPEIFWQIAESGAESLLSVKKGY